MSLESGLFSKTIFHKVKAVSVGENDNSTINESDFSDEDLCISTDEFENNRKSAQVPILKTEASEFKETSEEIDSALWNASKQGKHEVCAELLSCFFYENFKANINFKGLHGWTPLHVAAFEGHLEVCELLLSYNETVKINAFSENNSTPLHLACAQGHLEVAHLLLKCGADAGIKDLDGNTPLHLAAAQGRESVVSWLLLQAPDIYEVNREGSTVEDVATEECKRLLIMYKEIQNLLQTRKQPTYRPSFPPLLKPPHKRNQSHQNPFH